MVPVALVRDHASKTTFSHVVPSKGVEGSAYPARQVAFSISQLGHKKLVFKSDNEPAMLALKAGATKLLRSTYGIDVICEEPSVESHQSNGVIEHAAGELAGQVRTLNDQLQRDLSVTLPTNHPIYAWLVNYAGFLISRFQIGVDGKTPYQRLKGKPYRRPLAKFGECVHYMPIDTAKTHMNKLAARWRDGIVLGLRVVQRVLC